MAKTSKATKKFQNKHLKHTLEHRREVQKHNKKIALRKKGKSSEPQAPPVKKTAREVFDDMSVEQFFEGGFEVPKPKKGKNVSTAENESESASESDDAEAESDQEDIQGQDDNADDAESSEEEDEEMMAKNMEDLAEKDPDFYKYLKENDEKLLDFEAVNPLDAMSEDDESDEEEDDNKEAQSKPSKPQTDITTSMLNKWEEQLKSKPTPKLIQNIVAAFKTIVNINSSEDTESKYILNDPSNLTKLMMVGLKSVPTAITTIAPYKTNQKGTRSVNEKDTNVRNIGRILKLQAGAYLILLNEINNTETAALVLSSLQEVLPYYISQRKILKQIVTAVVEVWATADSIETQVATYAFLNNAAREFPKSVLEVILRSTYSVFLKNCKNTNPHTIDKINFAKNSAAELYGIDEQLSYTVGFEFVRQLAVHLRNSLTGTSSATTGAGQQAYKTIYNWQFCHSLDFWSRVLANQCNPDKEFVDHKSHESPLRSLIYPLVQVTLGTIRLIPTAQFFPLRFYLVRSLIRLSQGTQVFIPIFPLILEILTSTAVSKPGKSSSLQAIDFEYHIRVSQQYLGTKVFQDGISEQVLELSSEYFALYCRNIAFPELATPAILSLRRFMKKSKNIRFNKQIQQFVEKLNSNSTYISNLRSKVEYGPANKVEALNFLKDEKWESTPLGQYVVVLRKTREDRRRLLKEAFEEEEKAKKNADDVDMEDAVDALDSDDEESDEEEE